MTVIRLLKISINAVKLNVSDIALLQAVAGTVAFPNPTRCEAILC